MTFTCASDEITEAVNNAQRAINSKTTITLLEGLHISAGDDIVTIYGTDNEMGIECTFPARVGQQGETVVNARLFGDIVRNLPGETIEIENVDDTKIRITSGGSVYIIFAIQTDSFPPFPQVEYKNSYSIDQFTLKRMFSQTSFAIAADDTRKVLTGLFLESGNGELRAVAVDGFRIALRRHPVDQVENEIKMIIPARTINELIRIIPSATGDLRIYGAENQAVIEFGNCRVYTRIIDGEFFNYRYILPSEYMTQITVERQRLLEAVERAALIINIEQSRLYPVLFKISDDVIFIHALSDRGNADEEINVQMSGEPIELAFSPRYIIETLRAIEDDNVLIRFTTRVGQCIIKPVNNESYTYLILPVKVGY